MQFVFGWAYDKGHCIFNLQCSLLWLIPNTNCIFTTFRVSESFWTKKQSCKFSKVDIKKWRPFFDFVCFNGRHILKLRYLRSPSTENFFLFQMLLVMLKCFKKVHWQVCSNSYRLRWLPCHMCSCSQITTPPLIAPVKFVR